MPIQRSLNHDFFKTWSPQMAYVLGYFAADGTMIRNKRGGYYIEFTSTDRILLEMVKRVTRASNKISIRGHRNSEWKTQYRIQIGCKEWYLDLAILGFSPAKTKDLLLPEISRELFGHFVRGYFDGDGCVYFNSLKYADRPAKRCVLSTLFTSGSCGFLSNLCAQLQHKGLHGGSLVRKHRGYELKFSHRDSLALYQIMYNTAQVDSLFLPRKRKKLEKAIQVLGLT